MENEIEKIFNQFKMREAFLIGCFSGNFPVNAETAIKLANKAYPMPQRGELPEIEESHRVSIFSQRKEEFVPYTEFHEKPF
jgi:hypothetical protein